MTQLFTKRSDAEFAYTFDFTDQVPEGVTVASIVHSVPSGLTLEAEAQDVGNKVSSVRISGGTHGSTYQVKGVASLSNDEQVPQVFTLIVFDG